MPVPDFLRVPLKKPAQNGSGTDGIAHNATNRLCARRAPQRAAGFFPGLGARIRALCAIKKVDRRAFLAGALLISRLDGDEAVSEPWSKAELLQPADLTKRLSTPLLIICVTFPVLYRQKHIPHASFAGPTNKPEGMAALRNIVEKLPRGTEIVIYCGCCPMKNCPNIRPAYRALKDSGFDAVRVLDLPTSFHTDWVAKGYPTES